IFASTLDEPNGHTRILDGHPEADITILDVPVLASLLFQNTPTGRKLEKLTTFDVYEDLPPEPNVTSYDQGGANVVGDAFGKVYVRRRKLGTVPIQSDGSARMAVPGGVPIVLHLPDTEEGKGLPRFQRESMSFSPGEYAHQSFKRAFFDGLCAGCHGSISGKSIDSAVRPDLLTQASPTVARDGNAYPLAIPPGQRGPSEGPPSTP